MRENENPLGGLMFAFIFIVIMVYICYLCEVDESKKIKECLDSKRTYVKVNETQYGCR